MTPTMNSSVQATRFVKKITARKVAMAVTAIGLASLAATTALEKYKEQWEEVPETTDDVEVLNGVPIVDENLDKFPQLKPQRKSTRTPRIDADPQG